MISGMCINFIELTEAYIGYSLHNVATDPHRGYE